MKISYNVMKSRYIRSKGIIIEDVGETKTTLNYLDLRLLI